MRPLQSANYRAACRGRSHAEFTAKIGTAAEEMDESLGWLELLVRAHIVAQEAAVDLRREANELTAILAASHRTAKSNRRRRRR